MNTTIKASDIFLAIPPGETIAAELTARGQSIDDLAAFCGLDLDSARSILSGDGAITEDLAAKFGEFFGGSAKFWIRLETQYRGALNSGKPTEVTPRSPAGNIALRVPKSLHQRIRRLAAIEGVSMNHYLLAIVAEGVARQEMQNMAHGS